MDARLKIVSQMRSGLVVLLLVRASAAQGAPSPWDTAVCNQVHDGSRTNNATAGGCWQMAGSIDWHNDHPSHLHPSHLAAAAGAMITKLESPKQKVRHSHDNHIAIA